MGRPGLATFFRPAPEPFLAKDFRTDDVKDLTAKPSVHAFEGLTKTRRSAEWPN